MDKTLEQAQTSYTKTSSEKERISLWQKHFNINIKKGPFSPDELTNTFNHINNGKASGLDELPAEVWKLENVQSILLIFCDSLYDNQKIKRRTEGCILPFPKRETSL